ncbi:MAG: UPF0149 family protein, partial [candidate division Zixibacteria bacterium]|nr:UPF0149 family protein [candidate division Zixibacteria bacterium]NIW47144.1 UPF0149 family protein [Gammaproteobacteria bacterium]NIX58121.1 UPF0149 family protein [candidate division Zixibacteria bacterium]
KCEAIITALAKEIYSDLNSENFSMQLLLPDENTSLEMRCESFIDWCESFLSGLGVGGLTGLNVLTKESLEIIEDIQKICRLDPENFSGNTNE